MAQDTGPIIRMFFNDAVFPFRFAFDRQFMVTEVGVSLRKIAPDFVVGADLLSVAEFDGDEASLRRDGGRQLHGTAMDIRLLPGDARLRCQFHDGGDRVFAFGSPVLDDLKDLDALGLDFSDFAPHDATPESLILRKGAGDTPLDPRALLLDLRIESTERKRLAHVEECLAHDLNAAGDLVIRFNRDGCIMGARTSRPGLLPLPAEDLKGTDLFESCPQMATPVREAIRILGESNSPVAFNYGIRRDRESFHCDARIANSLGGELLLLVRDITEQKQLKSLLEHQATHDPLTDLPNRQLFSKLVDEAIESEKLHAVLFIDLDGFKLINDRNGHHFGDEVLCHVAKILKSTIGDRGVPARFGGDEFAVLLRGLSGKSEAEAVAQSLLDVLTQPARIGRRTLSVSASIGLATTFDAHDATTLFQFADIAMYRAKDGHKCCYRSFLPAMYEEMLRRDTLRQQLTTAGTKEQFVNRYQPIVEIGTGRLTGAETLARWRHPIRGLLKPAEFLKTAEESETIVRLGKQSLRTACSDMKTRDAQRVRPYMTHFNVSPAQIKNSCLATLISNCLGEYNLPPDRFTMEVREETFQEDFETAKREVEKVHEMGVHVALDEFGAGNYSLAFLERLPVSTVKLARPFVHQLGTSDARNSLVRAVIELANNFGHQVIAVGVESLRQEELLLEYGCRFAQGRYYCAPVTNDEIIDVGDTVLKVAECVRL